MYSTFEGLLLQGIRGSHVCWKDWGATVGRCYPNLQPAAPRRGLPRAHWKPQSWQEALPTLRTPQGGKEQEEKQVFRKTQLHLKETKDQDEASFLLRLPQCSSPTAQVLAGPATSLSAVCQPFIHNCSGDNAMWSTQFLK